jgi:hypothetical protein
MRSSDLIADVKCAWCGGEGSIGLYDGSIAGVDTVADVPCVAAAALKAL